MAFAWNDRQRQAIGLRGKDLLVSAAAGSGKTAVLTARVLSLLRRGVRPENLLIVTYTQAAAAQLRARIAVELEQDEDSAVAALSQELGRAKICTVHAFCAGMLREFFMQAGVEPMFRVLDAPAAGRLADAAQAQALEDAIAQGGQDVWDLYARLGGPEAAASLARNFYETSRARPGSAAWRRKLVEDYDRWAQAPKSSPWAEALCQRGREAFALCASRSREAATLCPEKLAASLNEQADRMEDRARQTDYDALFAPFPLVRLSFPRDTDGETRDAVSDRMKRVRDTLSKALAVPMGEALQADRQMIPALRALGELTDRFEQVYTQMKEARGALDFSDLEHRTLTALEDPQVRASLQGQFAHIFVDEYQDANELQEAILSAVSRGDNRFLVGDVKQSIYSFRMAEPSLFVDKYEHFDGTAGVRVDLNENYRSSAEVLGFANQVFATVMSPQVGGVRYDESAALRPGRAIGGVPTLVMLTDLDAPTPEGEDEAAQEIAQAAAARAEAEMIALRVRQLLGTPVPGDGGTRPAGFGDICVLLRSPKTWGSAVTETLLSRGIPVCGDADGTYYDLSEVRTFLNLLFVVDNRRRDVALIGAMTAPYGGFTPAELAHVRAALPDAQGSFFDAAQRYAHEAGDDLAVRLEAFLARLLTWRERSRHCAPGVFVRDLLDESGYLSYAGTLPQGAARAENLLALANRADGYETLSDFLAVAALGDEGSGEAGVPPQPEQAQAVRLMSIHRAKGLEFPYVILAGCAKPFNAADTSGRMLVHRRMGVGLRYADEEGLVTMDTLSRQAAALAMTQDRVSEEMRVLYVAMTRPIVGLTVTACVHGMERTAQRALEIAQNGRYGDARSFLDFLLPPLCDHPDGAALRAYAPCPVRAPRYESPFSLEILTADSVIEPPAPAVSAPGEDEPGGTDWVEKRLRWVYEPPAGALPRKLAVTRLSRTESELTMPVPDFASDGRAGDAARRGTALHALFAAVDPAALLPMDRVSRRAYITSRFDALVASGALTKADAASIHPRLVWTFYETPLGERVLQSPLVRREQPFNLTVPAEQVGQQEGRVMLQGVIDLYFADSAGELVVVDFKTGRLSDEDAASRYGRQVGYYAAALERMTGKRALGYLYLADTGHTVRVV